MESANQSKDDDVLYCQTVMSMVEKKNKVNPLTAKGDEKAFYVINSNTITKKYETWKTELPFVAPYYAVKVNDDPHILKHLNEQGSSFDCASQAEIQTALSVGVPPEKIIFSNPFKLISAIKYAARNGVKMLVFDSEDEVRKIKEHYPDARLVLRINNQLPEHVVDVWARFGCTLSQVRPLLELCMQLNMNVIGISFHMGPGHEGDRWSRAVSHAKEAFKIVESLGIKLSLLDIGGGYPECAQGDMSLFKQTSASLRDTLNIHFPMESGVTVIAEPGAFIVAGSHVLFAKVIGRKKHNEEDDPSNRRVDYVINCSMFGAFLGHHLLENDKKARVVEELKNHGPRYPSQVWGPTCAPVDLINKDPIMLPELQIGDWLMFKELGHYDTVLATHFNGIALPQKFYI